MVIVKFSVEYGLTNDASGEEAYSEKLQKHELA